MSDRRHVLGVVLAGGLSRRMGGGDKPLLLLGGQPILARVTARLAPQCGETIVNANGDPSRLAASGAIVVADTVPGHPGPLAGLLAGLEWALANRAGVTHVATVAGDGPFLPADLVQRLARAGGDVALASSAGRTHPVAGLWSVALVAELRHALVEEGERRVMAFAARHAPRIVEWPSEPVDPFFNVNTPEDLTLAGALIGRVQD